MNTPIILVSAFALSLLACSQESEKQPDLAPVVDSLRLEVEQTSHKIDSLRRLTDSIKEILN